MMKTLILDVETSPNIAHVWGLFKQTVSLAQLQEASFMMSFAAKWRGEKKIHYRNYNDPKMVEEIYGLVNDADAVVHYNGNSFDMPVLNREFVLTELPPPSPYKNIDLYRVISKKFRFASNKLAHTAEQLGVTKKLDNSGHELWTRCLAGDEKAWKEMRRYNIGDVKTTEELFERVLPWIDSMPNQQLYSEESFCPRCGQDFYRLERQGYAYTNLGKFQRFKCSVCKGWSRSNRRISGVEEQVAL